MEKRIERLEHTLYGNGQPGLVKDMSSIKGTLESVESMLQTLVKPERGGNEVNIGDRIDAIGTPGNLKSRVSSQPVWPWILLSACLFLVAIAAIAFSTFMYLQTN